MDSRPIGVFDSGIGGLSVLKALAEALPHESFVYFADSGRCPYGPRPETQIREFSAEITQFLLDKGSKAIVVACNTATAAAISYLRQTFPIPFVGIEPAIKPAALQTRTGVIGILATEGTFRGRHFQQTRQKYASDCEVLIQVGAGLVEQVEAGDLDSEETRSLVAGFLNPMLEAGADHIVLGCTHYPFLLPVMESISSGRATLIDPAPAVARQTEAVLKTHGLLSGESDRRFSYFTSALAHDLKDRVTQLCPQISPAGTSFEAIQVPLPILP